MGIFHCYVSLPEGIWTVFWHLKSYAQKVQVSLEKNVLPFPRWRMASRLVLAWATPWPLATFWRSPRLHEVCGFFGWKTLGKPIGSTKPLKIFVSLINQKNHPSKRVEKRLLSVFLFFVSPPVLGDEISSTGLFNKKTIDTRSCEKKGQSHWKQTKMEMDNWILGAYA